MNKILTAFAATLLVSAGAQAQTMAPKRTAPAAAPAASAQSPQAVPAALRLALIDFYGAGDPYAAVQINGSDYWLVYLDRRSSCGSGGCRAKIWKKSGSTYEYLNGIAVGALPIVQLPTFTNGMPDLGVTQFENRKAFLTPVPFDGESYSEDFSDKVIPANRGKVLISENMLKPLR